MSKERENKDNGFVHRYILKKNESREKAGLGEIIEAWKEFKGEECEFLSDMSGSASYEDSSFLLSRSGNLEDEVRAFDVDDSSSGKSSRPPSRSGSRYDDRGGKNSSRGGFGRGF